MITCSRCKTPLVEELVYQNWLTLYNFIYFLFLEKYIELETRDQMLDALMSLKEFAYETKEKP
mgnify:CR=1 FL=1